MSMSIAAARVSGNVPLASDVRSTEPVTTSPAPTVPLHGVAAQTPPSSTWRRFLADQDNLDTLALRLRGMAPWVASNLAPSLNKSAMEVHPDSAYASDGRTSVALAAFIADLGYKLPTTASEFSALALALEQRVALHPLGNFGAGLSWPIPMSQEDQRDVLRFLDTQKPNVVPGAPLPVEGLGIGTLAYFLSGSSLTQNDLQNPAKAINRLLDSPKAEALGQALQARLKGAPSDVSVYEYALTAIQLSLDPESARTPARNTIANFDLAQPEHWGQAPAQVIERLGSHLVAKGRATTSSAKLASHLLLARTAPQFLIKDIPQHVTIGSLAWANLSIAAAAIEAERPGTVAQMTFADVMRHSSVNENRSKAVDYAQTTVLVDWGIANGVIVKNAEDTYTTAQLKTVSAAFNQQLNDRLSASQALDQEIPTRKDIALTKLKARFGDLGALFEEKVLGTDQYRGEPEQTGLGGMHSLLEIAMMDLPNVRPFTSTDPRIPLKALNSNLTFGVREAFDQQFNGAIDAKKTAINTTVRHLISQLPLADRKQFEYGKVTFLQEGSYKLGTDLFGSTPGPNKPGLLVKTELNGETHVYEINFNAGRIERTLSSRANIQESREANTVFTTQEFKPQGMPGNLAHPLLTNKPLLNSFDSDRSHAIGSAFAQHLELNDPAIKEQARGQTTLESLQGGPKPLSEFLLNLVPFRSAIVNFQQGNYGEGALDLTLDIFGFLTAGAATAGKLLKIGNSALSTGVKTLRAARVIGTATIGVLNPVSGLGDLAAGGITLLGNGARYLVSKGAEAINVLKGAAGNYDLLKAASKNHGVAATGTYTHAEQTIECGAVFREGKWFRYDPVGNRPYGPALKNFTPTVAALDGEIRTFTETWFGRMIGSVLAPAAPNPNFRKDFIAAIAQAKTLDNAAYIRGQNKGTLDAIYGYSTALGVDDLKRLAVAERRTPTELGSLVKRIDELELLPDKFKVARQTSEIVDADAYKRGYDAGKPDGITGFSDTLTQYQLAELAVVRGRTPEELGRLVKYMENRRIRSSQENFRVFSDEITAAGGEAIPFPQGYYLSQVALLSGGECAALSNVMAAAVKQGKQHTFLKNLYSSMVPTLSPDQISALRKVDPAKAASEQRRATNVAKFNEQLNQLQGVLGSQFHHGMQARQVPYTAIIEELASAKTPKTILISSPDHGITAGFYIATDGKKTWNEWFYFDPNFGKATFKTKEAMSAALESTLNTGRTKSLLTHYGHNAGLPEYKISIFQEVELNNITKGVPGNISDLFLTEL